MKHSQLDLFRSPYHAVFVYASGQKSTVLRFAEKADMAKTVHAKMKLDGISIAYTQLCHWTGEKVQILETVYYGDKRHA